MSDRKVADIMTTKVVSVRTDDPLTLAVDIMREKNISCVVVMEERTVQGLITERDLVHRVLADRRRVEDLLCRDIMTRSLTSVTPNTSLKEAMGIVDSMQIRRLPVMDKTGLVGVITQTDIVNETARIHEHNEKMAFHQNLQSYIIIATVVFFLLVFLYRFFF